MIRRFALLVALAACADLGAGAAAWRIHVASIEALLDAQAATARALLAQTAGSVDPERLAGAIERPEIHVVVHGRGGLPPFPPPGAIPFGLMHRPHVEGLVAEIAHIRPRLVEGDSFVIVLFPATKPLEQWFARDLAICGVVLAGLIVAGITIQQSLSRAARAPLLQTTAALEALAQGDFTPQTVQAGEAPEMARLARAYNAAAETVARSIEERRAAAAEYQRFLADAGHELRTPLTIVGGYIDVLAGRDGEADPTEQRVIGGMQAQMARMRAMVEKMLLLSRLESPNAVPRVIEVASVAGDVADAMRDAYPGRQLTVNCAQGACVFIDEDDLFEALSNVVDNALRYAPQSAVEISSELSGDTVEIAVSDRGPGIPEAEQPMVFERFYRGKDRSDSVGSGLGLAIVRRIVERWNGKVSLTSDSSGTRVTMRFPQANEPA